MRNALAAGLMLAVAFPAVPNGQSLAAADETAIRRVVQQHDERRSSADWKGVGSLFAEDGATLTSAGEWRRGRGQIEKGGAQAGAAVYKGAKYATKIDSVRLLAPTVAIADGTFEIANIGGSGSRKGNTTYVLVKSGEGWRIAATRSMVPTPAGPTPPR
jgi:uncharacterized protein (TIGR02246 family)